MWRGEDDIKLSQQIIVIVKTAIGEYVHLRAGEDFDALDALIGLVNLVDLPAQAIGGQAVGLGA